MVDLDGLFAGGYVGYALTTAWDEGKGRVAAAAASATASPPDGAGAKQVKPLQVGS